MGRLTSVEHQTQMLWSNGVKVRVVEEPLSEARPLQQMESLRDASSLNRLAQS